MKKQPKFQDRIVVGEGYVGIDPQDRTSIKLYKDYDGYNEVTHNVRFINAINVDGSKYRLVLERVK